MITELIDRISIKKDGVYLSTHLSDNSTPFRTWRCNELSEVYCAEGQKGLDREVIRILYQYAQLGGTHRSLDRYRYATEPPEARAIHKKYFDRMDNYYKEMDTVDKDSIGYNTSHKVTEYRTFEQEIRERLYCELAARCEEYDRRHKNRDLER